MNCVHRRNQSCTSDSCTWIESSFFYKKLMRHRLEFDESAPVQAKRSHKAVPAKKQLAKMSLAICTRIK